MTVPGLTCVSDYLTQGEQDALLATIDSLPWRGDLRRRVQHYGYRYDYTKRNVDRESYLGPLPPWAATLATRLHTDGHVPGALNQLIVNEYQPGQGISSHIDCVPCFADTIISLSLGSACLFTMRLDETKVDIPLAPGSLLIMSGDSRYKWRHEIAPRKSDLINGTRTPRARRVSLTYRTVLTEN
ncbi:alpha-ketoglutarate-dependent dioxygenase AlkB [Actinocrispum sp. NPDC049592]|uniref:alpha-ketoglutarate-dependent dioxygenase AlkB n=1 Tax=Actinocrispum sp. NPDC049592 TaxID=3154835 RepID=UPI00342F38CC